MATNKRAFTMRMQAENIEYLIENCIEQYEKEHGEIKFFQDLSE